MYPKRLISMYMIVASICLFTQSQFTLSVNQKRVAQGRNFTNCVESESEPNTYLHHLVQVSPACLRINRRPVRGRNAEVCSEDEELRTIKLCGRVKPLFPSGRNSLITRCAEHPKQHVGRHRRFSRFIKVRHVH